MPDAAANMRINCDVGAASLIESPIAITIKGTNTVPPPIPNKLEIIPAKKLVPTASTIICLDRLYSLDSIFLLA